MTVEPRPRVLVTVLREAWLTWLALGTTVLLFMVMWFLFAPLSVAVRYTGMLLQICGLSTVAIGLSQMRQLFGRPSLGARILAWFGRLAAVFRHPRVVTGTMSVTAGSPTVTGYGRVVRAVRPGAPLEERLSALEENVDDLRKDVDRTNVRFTGELTMLTRQIESESKERRREGHDAARIIEEVAVGGLHLETVGLFWLVLGAVGTSIPEEIAALLSWLSRVAA